MSLATLGLVDHVRGLERCQGDSRTPGNSDPTAATAPQTAHVPRSVPRAEHVGSLVRPAGLREALNRLAERSGTDLTKSNVHMARSATVDELDDLLAGLIGDAVQSQIAAGLDVLSDGEYRRLFFTGSFDAAIRGFQPSKETRFMTGAGGQKIERPERPVVGERLVKVSNPLAREAEFMSSITDRPFKVTIPAPSMYCWYGVFTPGITDRVYADPDELADHVVALMREIVAEAITAGARYVQFDFPFYPLFVDEAHKQRWGKFGIDDDEAYLERLLRVDAAVIEGLPQTVRTALHLCRGNAGEYWMASGALDPVAERVFSLPYDSFLVEWDDKERDGDYSALRYVPKGNGPIVGLGVISTKRHDLESEGWVLAQIEEASQYLDTDQLALAPQCGFGTVPGMESATEELQWRKLELVGKVADRVWPG
jgi:5-methyltetrahydropteroyltriglutamate--homocysteine methyltransferase